MVAGPEIWRVYYHQEKLEFREKSEKISTPERLRAIKDEAGEARRGAKLSIMGLLSSEHGIYKGILLDCPHISIAKVQEAGGTHMHYAHPAWSVLLITI